MPFHILFAVDPGKKQSVTHQVSLFFSLASLSYFSRVLFSTMPVKYLPVRKGITRGIDEEGERSKEWRGGEKCNRC